MNGHGLINLRNSVIAAIVGAVVSSFLIKCLAPPKETRPNQTSYVGPTIAVSGNGGNSVANSSVTINGSPASGYENVSIQNNATSQNNLNISVNGNTYDVSTNLQQGMPTEAAGDWEQELSDLEADLESQERHIKIQMDKAARELEAAVKQNFAE